MTFKIHIGLKSKGKMHLAKEHLGVISEIWLETLKTQNEAARTHPHFDLKIYFK